MKRIAWSILLILPAGAASADVYRSVDENGVVVYSDLPTETSERVRVQAAPRAAVAPATDNGQRAGSADDESAADSQLQAEIPREATPEEIAADRARNCQIAQERAAAYSVSHRLFRTLPSGEREYLSDAETDAARAKAESDVASWCD